MSSFAAKQPSKTGDAARFPATKGAQASESPAVSNSTWLRLATRVQTKLAVSQPDDPAEREADQVADRVMRMPVPTLQRKCAACAAGGPPCPKCEEEQRVQRQSAGGMSSLPAWASFGDVEVGRAAQPKLQVGPQDDAYEREADQVAERVMRMPASSSAAPEEEAEGDTAGGIPSGELSEEEEESILLQETGLVRGHAQDRKIPCASVHEPTVRPPRTEGAPLDGKTRLFFESRMGHDFRGVRVYTGEESTRAAASLNAQAYTIGHDIVFHGAHYGPASSAGRRLLAHELTHVVQQGAAPRLSGPATRIISPGTVQRFTFQRVPAEPPRTPAQVRAMTLSEFESFATRQLDWATSPHLRAPAAADDLANFRQILDFARETSILQACGGMSVGDVITAGVPAVFAQLREYARAAVVTRNTAWLRVTNNVAEAATWAGHLRSLEAASDPATLRMVMPQPDPVANRSPFELLVTGGYVADFVNYLRACSPVLSATDGAEVRSYVALRGEGADPVSYRGRIANVRDYHHFMRPALDGLVNNEAVTVAQQASWWTRRPLTLVLHTAIDHNAAFHRAAGMTALILDPRILAIVLEGLPTLTAYQSQLAPIATRYGIGGRIEQVLIVGHGNEGRVGLAGTVAAGTVREEPLTHRGTAAERTATEDLIRELVRVMNTDPTRRRIALHACLTASHTVTTPIDPNNPATAATQIQAAIAANPNIRDFLQGLVGPGSTVLGVRASQPAQTFLGAGGRLELAAPQDPRLMGTVLQYVEHGTEPGGALRAVVEAWAADHARTPPGTSCRDAMNARLASPAANIDWYEQIIRGLYDRVLNQYWSNGAMINWFASLAGGLAHFFWADTGQAGQLWAWMSGLPATDVNAIFTRLAGSNAWTAQARIRLLFNEVWMRFNAARGAQFLAELAGYANCGDAARYVDMNVVRPQIGTLLTVPPPATPARGELMLALLEAQANPLPTPAPTPLPPHVSFLRALLGSATTFPGALNIGGLTAGLTDEASVLAAIGRSPAAPAPTGPGPAPGGYRPSANVDLDRDGINDFYLEPLTRSGTVVDCRFLNVRSRPWMGSGVRGVLAQGAAVRIVGRHRRWYGIEYSGRIRFVYNRYIQLSP